MDTPKESYTRTIFRRNTVVLLIIRLIIGISCLCFIYLSLKLLQGTPKSIIGILFSTSICLLAFKFIQKLEKQNRKDIQKNNFTWGRGLKAEDKVGTSLRQLPPDYKVIEDYHTGKGNIDFIVIGPTGIFTIEVKASKGKISYVNEELRINGKIPEKNYIAQTIAERNWLQSALKQHFNKVYPVVGLLEFPNGFIDKSTIKGPVSDNLWIGEGSFHTYLINKSNNCLSSEEIERIFNYLISRKNQN